MRALSSKFVAKSGIKWRLYEIFPTPTVLFLHPTSYLGKREKREKREEREKKRENKVATLRDLSNTCSFAFASSWKYFPILDDLY